MVMREDVAGYAATAPVKAALIGDLRPEHTGRSAIASVARSTNGFGPEAGSVEEAVM